MPLRSVAYAQQYGGPCMHLEEHEFQVLIHLYSDRLDWKTLAEAHSYSSESAMGSITAVPLCVALYVAVIICNACIQEGLNAGNNVGSVAKDMAVSQITDVSL